MVVLQPGSVFASDYEVVRVLDQGGMGTVYVAKQVSTGQLRALKILHPSVLGKDPSAHARFAQEAKFASKVNSAHFVQVVGAGVVDGAPWLAMELLEGETLRAYARRAGLLRMDIVAEVIEQLMFAVSAAHERGIVHRDLKPDNIFIATTMHAKARFTLKLLDFGIALVLERAETLQTTAMGTAGWMAPEQMYKGTKVGPYTDVWALGLIVFWLVAGRPYWLSEADELSAMSVLKEMDAGAVVPASRRAAEYGCPRAIPPAFDAWFARCTQREGGARFPDARAAHAELTPILRSIIDPAGAPTRVSPPTSRGDVPSSPGFAPARSGPVPTEPRRGGTEVAPFVPPPVPIAITVPPVVPPAPAPATRHGLTRATLVMGGAPLAFIAALLVSWTLANPPPERVCSTQSGGATEATAAAIEAACAKTCEARGGPACVSDGELLLRFHLTDRPQERAAASFEKGCTTEEKACRRAAQLLEGVKDKEAAAFFESACSRGDLGACAERGAMKEWAVPRDVAGAAAAYRKACDARGALGCSYLGSLLATGRGSGRDLPAARELVSRATPELGTACDAGDPAACLARVSGGLLVGERVDGGEASYRAACDRGLVIGCVDLATAQVFGLAGVPRATSAGVAALEASCDAGVALACANLGAIESGIDLVLRIGAGGALELKIACPATGALGVGCSGFGTHVDRPADVAAKPADAAVRAQRACDKGALSACVDLGGMRFAGVGLPRDPDAARTSFELACNSGEPAGCGELGTVFANGFGVVPDAARGRELLGQACSAGELDACVFRDGDDARAVRRRLCDDEHLAVACLALGASLLDSKAAKEADEGRAYLERVARGDGLDHSEPAAYVVLGNHEPNRVKAAHLFEQACSLGVTQGCGFYGFALLHGGDGLQKDEAKGESLLQRGCDAHDATSCAILASVSWGPGRPFAHAKSLDELENACFADGAAFACDDGAKLADKGASDLPPAHERAKTLRDRACALGETSACNKPIAARPRRPPPSTAASPNCETASRFRALCARNDCGSLIAMKSELSEPVWDACMDYCNSPSERSGLLRRYFPECR